MWGDIIFIERRFLRHRHKHSSHNIHNHNFIIIKISKSTYNSRKERVLSLFLLSLPFCLHAFLWIDADFLYFNILWLFFLFYFLSINILDLNFFIKNLLNKKIFQISIWNQVFKMSIGGLQLIVGQSKIENCCLNLILKRLLTLFFFIK